MLHETQWCVWFGDLFVLVRARRFGKDGKAFYILRDRRRRRRVCVYDSCRRARSVDC